MTPIQTLLSRVSVSQLRDPAPEGAQLERILRAGLCAPDHGRLRPWRFVLVRGEARGRLANIVTSAHRSRDPEVPIAVLERQSAKLRSAPLIIVLGVKILPQHKIPEIEQMLSLGAAAMNLLNAVHAEGFGAIWLTGPNSYDPAVAHALGFDPPNRLAGFLFVGTREEQPTMVPRANLSDHVTEWAGV